jgi:hypothetical protein
MNPSVAKEAKTECKHLNANRWATQHFTVLFCPECELRQVLSGVGVWSYEHDKDIDDLLCQYVQPTKRTKQSTHWNISKAAFDGLPAPVRELLMAPIEPEN